MHWQNNNTINECIIILLDIHWWSKRDGKAWLLRAISSLSLLSEGNPLFVSTAIIFSTPYFFIITPYSLSFLDPTVFPNSPLFSPPALFTFAQGDEDIPVRVDRNLGMMCVCVFVFKCVSMLYDTLVSRWEGGSLLCNLLRPTILPHLCEPPQICSFTHSFALPFTFHSLPPLLPMHFLLDLHLSVFLR